MPVETVQLLENDNRGQYHGQGKAELLGLAAGHPQYQARGDRRPGTGEPAKGQAQPLYGTDHHAV